MGKHNRKQSFVQALMEAEQELEKELSLTETPADDEGPEQELDFDMQDFGMIEEEES